MNRRHHLRQSGAARAVVTGLGPAAGSAGGRPRGDTPASIGLQLYTDWNALTDDLSRMPSAVALMGYEPGERDGLDTVRQRLRVLRSS